MSVEVVKVSVKTNIGKLSESIAIKVMETNGDKEIVVSAIGNEAIARAARAIAIARKIVKRRGKDLYCTPMIKNIKSKDANVSGMAFTVKKL